MLEKRTESKKMISTSRAKKILGKEWKNGTDQEVQDLLNQLYGLADLVTDQVLLPGSNENPTVIDLNIRKEHNGN